MKKRYKIVYSHGLHNDEIIWSDSPDMAKREGFALWRKNLTGVDTVFTQDFVVEKVIEYPED